MVDCKIGNPEKCREAESEYQDECIWLETERYKGIGVSDMYKCPWCGKHFNSRSFLLNQHIPDCSEREKALYGKIRSTNNKEKLDLGVSD